MYLPFACLTYPMVNWVFKSDNLAISNKRVIFFFFNFAWSEIVLITITVITFVK